MMNVTERLAHIIVETTYEDLPQRGGSRKANGLCSIRLG